MTTTTANTTRRAVLAGTAALPALAIPAAAETADPAIGAVRRWLAAQQAERAYHGRDDIAFENDPQAKALEADFNAAWHALAETRPTTPEGMALLLAVHAYDAGGYAQGAQIGDVETWPRPAPGAITGT